MKKLIFLFLLFMASLVVILGYLDPKNQESSNSPPTLKELFPEFETIDPEIQKKVTFIFSEWEKNKYPKDIKDREKRNLEFQKRYDLYIEKIKELGDSSVLPLLSMLVEEYFSDDKRSFLCTTYQADRWGEPLGSTLASLKAPSANPILFRILKNKDLHPKLRTAAIIALCWDGNKEGLDTLCSFLFDRHRENNLKRKILFRLPRLNLPLKGKLKPLLYLPFYGLDHQAAAALAYSGELEAPSLIFEGIQEYFKNDTKLDFFQKALIKTTQSAKIPPIKKGDRYLLKEIPSWVKDAEKEILTDPKFINTPFEKVRTEYLKSALRTQELALKSFENILNANDQDLNFASSALILSETSLNERKRILEKINRLTHHISKKFQDVKDPESLIQTINNLLFTKNLVYPYDPLVGRSPESFLPTVLKHDVGNCLGYSTLYLSLAERLNLPIFGIRAPKHIFVRYVQKGYKRNIEITHLGKNKKDKDYINGKGEFKIVKTSLDQEIYLTPLSKKEILSLISNNRSAFYLNKKEFHKGIIHAQRALILSSKNPLAHLNIASLYFNLDPGKVGFAKTHLKKALSLNPNLITAYQVLFSINFYEGNITETLNGIQKALEILRLFGRG